MVLAVCTPSEVVSRDGSFGEFINGRAPITFTSEVVAQRNLQGEIVVQLQAAQSLSVWFPINSNQSRTRPE